jgi:hypothetical protein
MIRDMPDDDLITFAIDGGAARNGNVPAAVFAAKLTAFLATIYALERTFNRSTKRQLDLEVVTLTRASPARVTMRARSRVDGYNANEALRWGVEQLERIRAGRADPRIPESVLSNVVSLADYRTDKTADIGLMRVELAGKNVSLDGVMAGMAMVARAAAKDAHKLPWRAGVSKGSVFGELRGIMDVDGGRKFYIRPPSGPQQIECVFPETLRDQMVENLFGVVRATGFLHYDGMSAHPHLLEAERLEGQAPRAVHISDLAGAFPDLVYEPFADEVG